MKLSRRTASLFVKIFKISSAVAGFFFIFLSLVILSQLLLHYGSPALAGFSGNMEIMGSIAALVSGITLVSILPESFRVKFIRPPTRPHITPTYGFTTLVAIGVGATIGSPLFIILPENVVQYAFVSLISLLIAGSLSFLISRIYSHMFSYTLENSIEVVGGPGFVKITTREKGLRYFISRFSMWIANTALAAFSAIFLFTFTFSTLPGILLTLGVGGVAGYLVETIIILLFGFWFVINAFYERRYLKTIGYAQIVMITIIIILILFQGFSLGFAGHWDMGGFFSINISSLPVEILENTGFLFILFFGFQEIQAMVREGKEKSDIPLFSKLFGLEPMPKAKYFPLSMSMTVIISLTIMLFNAVTIYAVHPDPGNLKGSTIPALYVVSKYLGRNFELVTASAFLLATVTTFVPAFIAASRHLRSLSEEGFFPRSVKSSSWLFTVMLIVLLSFTNSGFLVNITDFMVLIALGMISLSPFWLRKRTGSVSRRMKWISVGGAVAAFVIDVSLFPNNPDVVFLGVVAVILSFMMYDIISTGTIGLQLFVVFFDMSGYLLLSAFRSGMSLAFPTFPGGFAGSLLLPGNTLEVMLLLSAAMILVNILMDVFVISRTDFYRPG